MKYFSMFSGIGGFELGIEDAYEEKYGGFDGLGCVGYLEINKYANAIYKDKFPAYKNYGNAKELIPEQLPDFDLLVGGFPCQAFSVAGKRGGFDDTRGTLFYDVARVLKAKRPDWFLLENVKGLCSHESGKTLATIYGVLADLGYTVGWEVVNSCKFGVPQNRERIFIAGHLTEAGGCVGEVLPVGKESQGATKRAEQAPIARTFTAGGNSGGMHSSMTLLTQRHYYDGNDDRKIEVKEADLVNCLRATGQSTDSGVSRIMTRTVLTPDRLEKRQNGRRFKDNDEPSFTLTSQDKHGAQVGTEIRRLTPTECERLQGFPDGWTEYGMMDGEKVKISDTQRYKALGNAVTVNVIKAFMEKMLLAMR